MRSRTCITGMSKTDFMPGTPRIVASVIVYSFACVVGRGSDRLLFFNYARTKFFFLLFCEGRNFFSLFLLRGVAALCLTDHRQLFHQSRRRYERTTSVVLPFAPRASRSRRKRTARISPGSCSLSLSVSPSLCLSVLSSSFCFFFLPRFFPLISAAHTKRGKKELTCF